MKYVQIKSGQKLHLIYELPTGLTQPLCGIKTNHYRMTVNIPMGHSYKNCNRIANSKGFNPNEFLREYFN